MPVNRQSKAPFSRDAFSSRCLCLSKYKAIFGKSCIQGEVRSCGASWSINLVRALCIESGDACWSVLFLYALSGMPSCLIFSGFPQSSNAHWCLSIKPSNIPRLADCRCCFITRFQCCEFLKKDTTCYNLSPPSPHYAKRNPYSVCAVLKDVRINLWKIKKEKALIFVRIFRIIKIIAFYKWRIA